MSEVDREIAMQLSDDIGPMVKVWCAASDERTRDDHSSTPPDGTRVDAEDSFIVGGEEMDGPGDISAPPEQTVNCRCVLLWEPKGGWE
jgi:hypothetical protein